MSGITVELINGADLKPGFGDVKSFGNSRVIPIFAAPYHLYHFAMSIKNLADGIMKKVHQKIADSILDIVGDVAEITKVVSIFVGNTAFSVAASFFSTIQIVIHGKQLYHSLKFQKDLKEGNPLKEMNDYQIERRLKIDASLLKGVDVTSEKMKIALRKRSIQQTLSHALQITAAAISIVASAILLAFPPLAPIAFGLWAVSVVILLADFIADKAIANQFEKACLEAQPSRIAKKNGSA